MYVSLIIDKSITDEYKTSHEQLTAHSAGYYTKWQPKYSGLVLPSAHLVVLRIWNSGFCCDVLWRLRVNVLRRRPELWKEQTWLLHHDNAPSHTSVHTQKLMAKH
jgi:hypothetical protein